MRSVQWACTIETYAEVLRWLGEALPPGILLADLSAEPLRRYVHDSRQSNASQRKRFTHLRAFARWCERAGYVDRDLLADVDAPKERKKLPAYLNADDFDRLIACILADAEMKRAEKQAYGNQIVWLADVVRLAVFTGARQGSLLDLRWPDVDFASGTITFRKTKSGNEVCVPMVPQARAVLERLYAQRTRDGYVLTGQGGGRLNGNHVSRRFKHYVRLAKLDERLKFHSLRHTTGSWLVQHGVSLEVIAAVLGHADTRVTRVYSHMHSDTVRRAMLETFGRMKG